MDCFEGGCFFTKVSAGLNGVFFVGYQLYYTFKCCIYIYIWINGCPNNCFFTHPYGIFSTYQYPSTMHPNSKRKGALPQERWETLWSLKLLCWNTLWVQQLQHKSKPSGTMVPKCKFCIEVKRHIWETQWLLIIYCTVCRIETNMII